ncbi:MAG TPA: DUF1328 family protein [Burkholderiales bacterium]|nr:DUF1328 family protein [Burkholderiales bacterium]
MFSWGAVLLGSWAVVLFVLAIITGLLGLTGIAATAMHIGSILLVAALALAVALFAVRRRGPGV